MKRILILLFVGLVAFSANAQILDLKSEHSLSSDTVTNTGTQWLEVVNALRAEPATTTTVWVSVTKISGTVGGTISLQGSLDGVTYKALYAPNGATALATFTATDATNTYHWIISGSPFPYYRVSWTGTGTMSASFSAKLYRAK